MMNAQPSILGQQPMTMGGHSAPSYNGAQYPPPPAGPAATQHSGGWNSSVTSVPMQQMHNPHYFPPGSMPSEMGPGMMPMHSQNGGMPHSAGMAPYPQQ